VRNRDNESVPASRHPSVQADPQGMPPGWSSNARYAMAAWWAPPAADKGQRLARRSSPASSSFAPTQITPTKRPTAKVVLLTRRRHSCAQADNLAPTRAPRLSTGHCAGVADIMGLRQRASVRNSNNRFDLTLCTHRHMAGRNSRARAARERPGQMADT
jgi:hypothetical protein